jgi:hypothetical protein
MGRAPSIETAEGRPVYRIVTRRDWGNGFSGDERSVQKSLPKLFYDH